MSYDDEETYLEQLQQETLVKSEREVALAELDGTAITISASFTRREVLDFVAERACERLFGRYGNEGLEHDVKKHVHALVAKAAQAEIEARVSESIGVATAQILADGFQQTDSYGHPRGERKSVGAFVLEYLQNKRDNYSNSKAPLYEIADKLVAEYLQKHIQPELEKLKKRCVDALDNSVSTKIREAVITGLGLRA